MIAPRWLPAATSSYLPAASVLPNDECPLGYSKTTVTEASGCPSIVTVPVTGVTSGRPAGLDEQPASRQTARVVTASCGRRVTPVRRGAVESEISMCDIEGFRWLLW